MAKVEIRGLDKLQKKLKKNCTLDDVKTVVKQNGIELQRNTVRNAVFKGNYTLGNTKRSIRGEKRDDGFTYVEGPTTEYAPYVEFGTRFMDAQPFVRPAFKQQVPMFKSDMKKLVK